MPKVGRCNKSPFFFALFLFGMLLAACQEDVQGMSREEAGRLTTADFYGYWYTVTPEGGKWQLVLHENGWFESLPVQGSREKIVGRWNVSDGGFIWEYPGGAATGGITREVNPIILKTAKKFMLSEKMGMTSVYARSFR